MGDIGQNVRRRAKLCAELLQREDIQNKSNNFEDYGASKYGSSMQKENAISSYDDYFDAADKEDNMKRLKNEREKKEKLEREEEENEKKKKKKKKKAKKNEFRKQQSAFSSGDESDAFPASKPKKTKKKKKKKVEYDENDAFADDNTSFFDTNKNDKKGLVASSEDLFSSSNDDPFWKSNTVQTGQSTPNKVDKVKSISIEEPEEAGGDLMDFFASPSPTNNVAQVSGGNGFGADPFGNDKTMNTVSMNERNRLKQKDFNHQQQRQSNDPFNSFGSAN